MPLPPLNILANSRAVVGKLSGIFGRLRTKIKFRMHQVDMTLKYHNLPIGTQKGYLLSKGELEMGLSSQRLKLNLKSVISLSN